MRERSGALLGLLAIFGLALLHAAAAAGEETGEATVVVHDFRPAGVEPAVAEAFTDLLCVELDSLDRVRTRCRRDIDSLLQHQGNRQLLGCQSDECLADLSGALGAGHLVYGTIGTVGQVHLMTIHRLDVARKECDRRIERRVEGGIEALLDQIPAAAREIVADIAPQPSAARPAAPGTMTAAGQPAAAVPAAPVPTTEAQPAVPGPAPAPEPSHEPGLEIDFSTLTPAAAPASLPEGEIRAAVERWRSQRAVELVKAPGGELRLSNLRLYPRPEGGCRAAFLLRLETPGKRPSISLRMLELAPVRGEWQVTAEGSQR